MRQTVSVIDGEAIINGVNVSALHRRYRIALARIAESGSCGCTWDTKREKHEVMCGVRIAREALDGESE